MAEAAAQRDALQTDLSTSQRQVAQLESEVTNLLHQAEFNADTLQQTEERAATAAAQVEQLEQALSALQHEAAAKDERLAALEGESESERASQRVSRALQDGITDESGSAWCSQASSRP